MKNEIKIGMHRLNPTHKVDDEVFMGFFPPTVDYMITYYKTKISNYS